MCQKGGDELGDHRPLDNCFLCESKSLVRKKGDLARNFLLTVAQQLTGLT